MRRVLSPTKMKIRISRKEEKRTQYKKGVGGPKRKRSPKQPDPEFVKQNPGLALRTVKED